MKKTVSYGSMARKRRRRRKTLRICMLVLVMFGVSVGAWKLLSSYILPGMVAGGQRISEDESDTQEREYEKVLPAGAQAPLPTATPMAYAMAAVELPQVERSVWNTSVPVEATLDKSFQNPDWRMLSLPTSPAVDTSYFNTATFVGDSLTQGLELYSTGLPNAHYCAYKGTGPNAIVNGATLTRANGTQEICLDALVASQPDYVYMLLGTNSLVSVGNDDSFLNYYGAMIDLFQANLSEQVVYYVQAIPGVASGVTASKPGLDNDRIRAVNSRLAQLAREKGCYFIDLQEALSDDNGVQLEQYGASDGIHYNAEGYQAWVDYLCTHTVYNRRNPYKYNPYYIDPAEPNAPIPTPPPEEEAVEESAEEGAEEPVEGDGSEDAQSAEGETEPAAEPA